MARGSAVTSLQGPAISSCHQTDPLAAQPLGPHPSDGSLALRLTAFVLKSFGQARAYVAIEEQHITDALHWLQRQQLKTGCFRSVGKLFNNALQVGTGWCGGTWGRVVPGTSLCWWHRQSHLLLPLLQGGVSDELSLSAYVTAALLELGVSPTVRATPGGE